MRRIREKIEQELKALDQELRFELPKEIQKAAAHGDLRENAEYKAALERQSYVKARLGQLSERLSQLSTLRMSQIPRDRVAFGSLVLVRDVDTEAETRYELVFGDDSEAVQGRVSVSSPIGRALLGKQEGDEVNVSTPGGVRTLEIVELITLHDRAEEDADGARADSDGGAHG
jgi:transcription elongation factor GreA